MATYTADHDKQHLADVIAARAGDQEAMSRLWEVAIQIADHRAKLTCHRYGWLDPDDIRNELVLKFPKVLELFNIDSPNPFSKFVYFSFAFRAKDILRAEDPLGIGYPQKKQYPQWHRLGDEAFNAFDADSGYQEPIDELIAEEGAAEPLFVDLAHLDVEIAQRQSALDEISFRPPKNQKGNRKQRPKPNPLPIPIRKKRKPFFSKRSFPKNSLKKFLRNKKTANEKIPEGTNQMQVRNERKQMICDVFRTHTRLTVSQAISFAKLFRWQFRPAWEELLTDGEIIRNGKLKQEKGPLTQMFSLKGVPQMEQTTEQPTAASSEQFETQSPEPTPTTKDKKSAAAKSAAARGWEKRRAKAKADAKAKAKSLAKQTEASASDQLMLAMKFANAAGGIRKGIALLEQLAALRS